MLQEMEEHGRQHVLLFRPKKDMPYHERLNPKRVRKALMDRGFSHVLDSLPSTETPGEVTLTHLRFEDGALVFKALEAKEAYVRIQTIPFDEGREIRFEQLNRQRRAKLARLHLDGLLEVRLSTLNSSRSDHSYAREAEAFLKTFNWLVEPSWFDPASLKTFKARVWNRPRNDGVQVLNQEIDSDGGGRVKLSAHDRTTDAAEDQGLQASKSAVLARDGSSLGKTEVRWEGQADRRPYSDVTIRVTREPNEFAVGQASTKADYDHVFDAIRKLGRL